MGHDEPVSIAESKARVRSEVRAARSARSQAERTAAAEAIAEQCLTLLPEGPVGVSAYLSLPTEPGTDPLLERLHTRGDRVLVPRIDGRSLDWIALQPDSELSRGPMGIREPVGPAVAGDVLTSLAVLFLPGLSVDRDGVRLGQGGGYYDAALAGIPAHADGGPLRAIVLFDEDLRDEVPHDERDARVDCAVTPSGVVRFSS